MSQPRPIILCPLRYEMRSLQRAGLGQQFDFVCSGPGAARVTECVNDLDRDRPIVLAGLAGGLTDSIAAGSALIVDEVVDPQTSQRWTPTLHFHWDGNARPFRCIVTSVNSSVVDREEKIALHRRSGATIVDHESVAFAQAACQRGNRWAIVRGISDDLQSHLPAAVDQWVDERGRTRIGAVLKALVLHPGVWAVLPRLQSNSRRAMRGLKNLLRDKVSSMHPESR